MGVHVIKLPDVGEGVAEAELVEWMIEEGQNIREDEVLAAVMTDKATVEIPSPVEGKIIWKGAAIGEVVAVGSPIIRVQIDGAGNETDGAAAPDAEEFAPAADKKTSDTSASSPQNSPSTPSPQPSPKNPSPMLAAPAAGAMLSAAGAAGQNRPVQRAEGAAPLASPAVRKRALDNGVDLRSVMGSGPAGRITHEDLDGYFQNGPSFAGRSGRIADGSVLETPIIGLRRKIAEKMTVAKSRIPHITYVDEIDVSALEDTRAMLNKNRRDDQPKLTMLPFLMRAMARAIAEQPQLNARFDDEAGIMRQYGGMHMGVAAQTDSGLVVPVVRHVEARSLWDCASELARLAEAARKGQCTRDELSGSTITITSLGAMGGVVTTPVINYPEVAIIGVNKMQVKPVWDGGQFVPRKMMNLSSSFDHRVIDGWDAAVFIQRIKALLESPAAIFIDE